MHIMQTFKNDHVRMSVSDLDTRCCCCLAMYVDTIAEKGLHIMVFICDTAVFHNMGCIGKDSLHPFCFRSDTILRQRE